MSRFRLHLAFDGRGFMGWQRQRHGPSIQAALEEALAHITGEEVAVFGAGRTDAGVHASCMVAHVDIARPLSAFRLMEGMNARLRFAGQHIAILSCTPVPESFHARFSCIERSYTYTIVCRRAPLVREAGFAWQRHYPLDIAAMQQAARLLVGRHDFTTFRNVHCQAKSPVRTLDFLDVFRGGTHVWIRARARSFLHHQVRSMVGALVFVGEGRWTPANLGEALAACDRARLPVNAPAEGLSFTGAKYPPIRR